VFGGAPSSSRFNKIAPLHFFPAKHYSSKNSRSIKSMDLAPNSTKSMECLKGYSAKTGFVPTRGVEWKLPTFATHYTTYRFVLFFPDASRRAAPLLFLSRPLLVRPECRRPHPDLHARAPAPAARGRQGVRAHRRAGHRLSRSCPCFVEASTADLLSGETADGVTTAASAIQETRGAPATLAHGHGGEQRGQGR
jgi:hypothetical protein